MAETQLFVVFPEYVEGEQQPTAPYIKSIDLLSVEEIEDYINKINDIIFFITHENYQGFYDMDNVRAFGKPLEELEDCYPGKNRTLMMAINAWDNWRDTSVNDGSTQYFYHTTPLTPETLSEIAFRKKTIADNTYLVINNNAIECQDEILPVYDADRNNQEIEHRECTCGTLHKWFITQRKPPRIFNFNPKHGENGVGHRHDASPLRCLRGEAEEMLHKAVGESPGKPLFYYDTIRKQYIEFKNEKTKVNTYHAFHVENNIVCHRIRKEVIKKTEQIVD